MGKGSRVSLTDLHKGTHNCAAAIRESGAGISPSTPPLPSRRRPLRPPSLQQPARSTPRRPPSASSPRPVEGGDGARALSQCAAIIFPHEWAAVSVVPGLVLRCSCCIFYPSPSRSPPRSIPPSLFSRGVSRIYVREKRPRRTRVFLFDLTTIFFQGDFKGRYVSGLIEQLFSIENSPLNSCKKMFLHFPFLPQFSSTRRKFLLGRF